MLSDSDEENVNIPPFRLTKPTLLENFIFGDGRGIHVVNIDLVPTTDFHFKSLSKGAKKICEHENSAGGNSEISEAFSFEIFARWKKARLDKVSRAWPFVYCN